MEAKSTIITTHILTFSLLIFLLFISNIEKSSACTNTTTKTSKNTYKNYLKTACNSTTYPKLCYSSLSPYSATIKSNYQILCTTALNTSLQFANNTSFLLTTLSNKQGLSKTEAEVVQDCIYEIGDSIDELNQSLNILDSLEFNASDVRFQISNIQTWVSAAITDEDTCVYGFDDTKVRSSIKRKIKKSILNVARMTSIALGFINKLNF